MFSLSLTFPVIEPNSEIASNIINVTDKKLLTNHGLKTLAKGEQGYIDIYEGDAFKRDSSYHQGPAWPWLLGLYYNALKNMIKWEKNTTKKKELMKKQEDFCKMIEESFTKALYEDGAVGSIGEIYDTKAPYACKGTFAQAWSVAEVFRIALRK